MNDPIGLELAVPLYFIFIFFVMFLVVVWVEKNKLQPSLQQHHAVLLPPENTKYKGTLLLFSVGDTGELCVISPPLGRSQHFIHISFQFCLNSNMSQLTFFCHSVITCNSSHLLSSIKLWPWHGRIFLKNMTNLCTNVYNSESASFNDEVQLLQICDTGFGLIKLLKLRKTPY